MKRQIPNENHQGMTLIEVIVALAILGIMVISFIPLQVYLTKATTMNRIKMQAQNEVNLILEKLTAEVNREIATDKKGYDSGSQMQPGVSETSETRNDITYTIKKVIKWVDDPRDGVYPADTIPFDYKNIDITVTATGPFGKPITKTFSATLARHGEEVPYTGILVEVQRAYDNPGGHDEPVAGVLVTLSPISAAGTSASSITNEKGLSLLSVDIPASWSDSQDFTYEISLDKGGYMMNPDQLKLHGGTADNWVKVKRWRIEKSNIMQFEPAAHLKFTLDPSHLGTTININTSDGTISENIAAGSGQTSPIGLIESTPYWPISNVGVEAVVTAWQEPFDSEDFTVWQGSVSTGDPPVNIENLWQYQSGYWDASSSNHQPNAGYHADGNNRLVSPVIDLHSFTGGIQVPLTNLVLSWEEGINPGGIDSGFNYLYVSNSSAAADASTGWDAVRSVGAHATDPIQNLSLDGSYVTNGFRIRFDSSTSINYQSIDNLKLETKYEGTISFTPGVTRIIPLTW